MDKPRTNDEAALLELERLDSLSESSEHPLIQKANAEYYALPEEERLARIRENLNLTPSERVARNSMRVAALFAEAGEPLPEARTRIHLSD